MKLVFREGQTVLFQGDSITDAGRSRDNPYSLGNGYAKKVVTIYNELFPNNNVKFVNRGISGNRAIDLVNRYEDDFKKIEPDFVSILVGVNEVLRTYDQKDYTSDEQFEKNYRNILDNLHNDFPYSQIMIIEPFLLETDSPYVVCREELNSKIQIVRKLALEYADYYLPLDGIMSKYLCLGYTKQELTTDSIHPNDDGSSVIAYEYLKALHII